MRGVLWIVDVLEKHEVVAPRTLHEILQLFYDDDLVFLPEKELLRRIRRLAKLR